jgi:hypothetical protein
MIISNFEDGLYVVQSIPRGAKVETTTVAGVTTTKPMAMTTDAAGNRKKLNRKNSKKIFKNRARSHGNQMEAVTQFIESGFSGRRQGVTNRESNTVRDITIDTLPYEYQNLDSREMTGLLAYLLRGRGHHQFSGRRSQTAACAPQDVFVNYIYEYDIQNQVFNSSFADANSKVIQQLQADIADSVAEEVYKRNLAPYVTDAARLVKIIDVSKQYNNRAVLRFYVSINVSKSLIPVIRRILEIVFGNLQKRRFATSNHQIDWGKMVLIPIDK